MSQGKYGIQHTGAQVNVNRLTIASPGVCIYIYNKTFFLAQGILCVDQSNTTLKPISINNTQTRITLDLMLLYTLGQEVPCTIQVVAQQLPYKYM